jgi:hypothetical protein
MKFPDRQRQRIDGFKGIEHLGIFCGHGTAVPKCAPSHFDAVMIVPPSILERGGVLVDLVEPGVAPSALHRENYEIVREETFKDCSPWVVVSIASPRPPG